MTEFSRRMLVIAPHPDDETLGAGGTIARFTRAGGDVAILTVAAHMPPLYSAEVHHQTIEEAHRAHSLMGVKESIFLDYPAVLLRDVPTASLNATILEHVDRLRPEIVLVPYYDRHIDHRIVFEAAMVATRPVGAGAEIQVVAAYETLSETHWNAPHIEPNFVPNWLVDISESIDVKTEAMRAYGSQLKEFPGPRSLDALRALALFRGSQIGVPYAEGFHIVRMSAPPDAILGS